MIYRTIIITACCFFIATLQPSMASTECSIKKDKEYKEGNIAYNDGNVRFTFVTEGMLRLEYAPDGNFTEQASLIARNRKYENVRYKVSDCKKTVIIETAKMTVKYKKTKGPFNENNLQIVTNNTIWRPGTHDTLNLKGTYLTLDRYDGDTHALDKTKIPLEDGLLSRSGWTVIDDSEGLLLDEDSLPWVHERKTGNGAQDWYFMAYGTNYRQALKDFTVLSGRIPMPPRYALGYWWSRYWTYSDNEIRSLVNKFNDMDIPLDVLVLDMDWHYTDKDRGGWTGYTWNKELFPDPGRLMKWLRNKSISTTLNLHPADGVRTCEEHWQEMSEWMGIDTTLHKDIEWAASDKHFMRGWIDTQLIPLEKQGVDFWWLDWQQQYNDKQIAGLNNVFWLNHVVFTDMQNRRDGRPLLYHRWGGLGNHRYQIGFSGDTRISWKSLDYQPYFNSTASNVLYGYWSHDIGGHHDEKDNFNAELYVRWLQFGAFSPIMRTHSSKVAKLNKEPWAFNNDISEIIRTTIKTRYRLVPYIYTMARKAHEEGLSICRPMYYDYPANKEAYDNRNEYMFGDNMLVYPITAPADNGVSAKSVWLPSGNDWFEVSTGTLLKGGQAAERKFMLDEIPVYIKAGAIIPYYNNAHNLKRNDEPITVTVYPSSASNSKSTFSMYEDNGNDKYYSDSCAWTTMTSERAGNRLTVKIGRRTGTYRDMPADRQYCINIIASRMPEKVRINKKECAFTYNGNELMLTINIPYTACSEEKTVEIIYPDSNIYIADGTKGRMKHIQQAIKDMKRNHAGISLPDALHRMESTGISITYNPGSLNSLLEIFNNDYNNIEETIRKGLKQDSKNILMKYIF